MNITVEDLPRWHILHDGLAVPRGLSAAERETPLRVVEHHVRVSDLDGEIPACGYSTAVLAARALMAEAGWPTVGFGLRVAVMPDMFQHAFGASTIEGRTVVGTLRNALWACGQADAFAKAREQRARPWLKVLVLAHCVGALELAP